MRCDLGRVSSSPHTSISPFSFVWLVCLIWNLFQERCLASCVGLGHWHLSSPLLEDWLEVFVSSQHWPRASVATSRVTRDHQLSIRGQAELSPRGIAHPHTGLGGSATCYFTARVGRRKKPFTLNSCFTALITKDPLKPNLWPCGAEPWACDEFSWHQMGLTGMKSLKGWNLCL